MTATPERESRDAARRKLRERMRRARAALPTADRIKAMAALSERLADLPELATDERIAGYWASDGEMPLAAVLPPLLARGVRYHLPVVPPKLRQPLWFAPWRTGQAVRANRFGIPEPADAERTIVAADSLELVLCPLVAFDRRGHRLGMGGGFYDATFSFLAQGERPREPLLVGIAYSFQELDALAPEAHDVHLDYVCTERELIECVREASAPSEGG
jgi:5-formyltetrahydrofolate cyclo-ligase